MNVYEHVRTLVPRLVIFCKDVLRKSVVFQTIQLYSPF